MVHTLVLCKCRASTGNLLFMNHHAANRMSCICMFNTQAFIV